MVFSLVLDVVRDVLLCVVRDVVLGVVRNVVRTSATRIILNIVH